MSERSQKEAFIHSEADEFYRRNKATLQSADQIAAKDKVLESIKAANLHPSCILEIGCSNGWRLEALRKAYNARYYGIDPSAEAVREGRRLFQELTLEQGTADSLPFDENTFDLVIFGFCLYLCDRNDLFKIAYEADRVLQDNGHVAILDFDPPFAYRNEYKHVVGMSSYKMNYANLFLWNPAYTLLSRIVFAHDDNTDPSSPDERLSVSLLQKNTRHAYPDNPFRK